MELVTKTPFRTIALVAIAASLSMAESSTAQTLKLMKLNRAAQKNSVATLNELLDAGLDVNGDVGGQTALFHAAWKGSVDAAKLLIDRGADVNHHAPDGRTPLCVAATFGQIDVARVLLEHGADPSVRTNDGETPLDLAKKGRHEGVVSLLLERGGVASKADSTGGDTVASERATSPTTRSASHRVPSHLPGVSLSFRQPCPDALMVMMYAASEVPFEVDVDLESSDRLLQIPAFLELVESVAKTTMSTCENGQAFSRINLTFTCPDFSDPSRPAAVAVYRKGMKVQLETGQPQKTVFRNYVYAKRARQDFRAAHGVDAEPDPNALIANPFLFDGQVVSLILTFESMETADTGRFGTADGRILVTGIPRGRFRLPHKMALVAGEVVGKSSVTESSPRLTTVRFKGALDCVLEDCAELKY